MLPKLISKHPYFHENINKEQGIKLLEAPGTEGNFLFCQSPEDKENDYWLLCKRRTIDNKFVVETYNCSFHKEKFGSMLDGSYENIFSGLNGIVNHVVCLSEIALRFKSPYAIFTPQPVFNTLVQANKLSFKSDKAAMPLLPNEVTKIIFQKINDFNSLLQTARISKSCYALFNQNRIKVIQQREKMEDNAIENAQHNRNKRIDRRLNRGNKERRLGLK